MPRASTALISATICGMLGSPMLAAAHAASSRFTFHNIEFQPRDQRETLARAYVARTMPPGISMQQAEKAARRAGAPCGARAQDGSVICRASSFQHHPGDQLQDVIWTVWLRAGANGALNDATVIRSVVGT